MASQPQGGSSRPRPGRRAPAKVPSPLLRKARMIAVSRSLPLEDYVEAVLRPAIERDYRALFSRDANG